MDGRAMGYLVANSHRIRSLWTLVQKWSRGLSRRRPDEYRGRPLTPRALMPYKANEPRRHKIPKARYKIENWAEYDAALRRRGSLTVWVTPEAQSRPGCRRRPGGGAGRENIRTWRSKRG